MDDTKDLNGNILAVDDVTDNLDLLAMILTEAGHEVRTTTSGSFALQAARSALPDLILLDIRMPEMDGFEVCRQLKEDPALRGIPVIFISALSEIQNKVKAFEAGGVDYLTKPFQEAEVLARVRTHLALHRMQTRLEELVAGRSADLFRKTLALQDEIEERKKTEAALRGAEFRYRTLTENSPDNIARYDREGRPVYINPRLAAFLGFDPTEVYGRMHQELHPDGAYADYYAMVMQVIGTGSPVEMELTIPGSENEVHLIHFVPEYDEHGQIMGALTIGRDITEYKRTQMRLGQQEAELAANKTAIRVLLNHGRQSETETQENMQATLEKMVLPYLDQAAQFVNGNESARAAIQLARECLQQATAPLAKKLSAPSLSLSPRELQIAGLVKQGQSTKEIAAYLHLAPGTVEFYRDRLRRKLQIKNKKTNLRTYLLSLNGE